MPDPSPESALSAAVIPPTVPIGIVVRPDHDYRAHRVTSAYAGNLDRLDMAASTPIRRPPALSLVQRHAVPFRIKGLRDGVGWWMVGPVPEPSWKLDPGGDRSVRG